MSSFETGRAKAGGLAGLAKDWFAATKANNFGFPVGKPIGQYSKTELDTALQNPVAESVGGLSIMPKLAIQQLTQGATRAAKRSGKNMTTAQLRHLEESTDMMTYLPQKTALNFIRNIATKNNILKQATGSGGRVLGRTQVFSGGSSEITRTLDLSAKNLTHEISHGRIGHLVKSTQNNTRSKAAKLIDEMRGVSRRATDRFNAARKGQGIRYTDYMNINPDEMVARNLANRVRIARNKSNKPLTDKQFRKMHQNSMRDAISTIEKNAPELLKKGKESVLKKYRIKSGKIERRPLTENEKIDSIFSDMSRRKFPKHVKSPEEATALGKEFSIKELNRVKIKETNRSQELAKRQEWDRAQEHALRSQGAREALESRFVGEQGKAYAPSTGFSVEGFQKWLDKKL